MKKPLDLLRARQGVALATVLIVFASVAVLGTVTATIAVSETKSASKAKSSTAADYLARSAVDLVSNQLESMLESVDSARAVLLNAPPEQKTQALAAYESAKNELDTSGIVPSSYSAPALVILSGIADLPVTVYVTRVNVSGTDWLDVSCSLSYSGSEGSAKARVSSIAQQDGSFTLSSYAEGEFFWQGDALYAWGDITVGNNVSVTGGSVTAGGTVTGIPGQSGVHLEMPILLPPSQAYSEPNRSWLYQIAHPLTSSRTGSYSLTVDDSGYYDSISIRNNVTWAVNTSGGDVILCFDSLVAKNKLTINVTGPNRLYIYLIESTSTPSSPSQHTLLDLQNNLTVTGVDSSGKPLTYFIVYNDVLQMYYQTYHTNLISAEDVQNSMYYYDPGYGSWRWSWDWITEFDWDWVFSGNWDSIWDWFWSMSWFNWDSSEGEMRELALDIVNIKNGPDVNAYFYMPYCNVTIKNNAAITGAVYTGEFNSGNNSTISFRSLPDNNDLFKGFSVILSDAGDETFEYTEYIFEGGRVWLD